ncbi:MAG: choice-of-anchor tandem repeat GloVer-containing protein [Planctomycetota bacterium]
MCRTWLNWLLIAAIVIGTDGFAEFLRGMSATADAQQIVLRQTPLGPMPTDPRQISIARDGSRVALVANTGSRQQVFIDGNEGPQFSTIEQMSGLGQGEPGPRLLMISPDLTRIAYAATKGPSNWVMVINQKEGPSFDRILYATFSPVGHRLAYIALKGSKTYVVVDDTISPGYQTVMPGEMRFTADGKHFGYTASTGTGPSPWRVVVDGKERQAFITLQGLRFSSDGEHFAYIAQPENNLEKNHVVVDDKVGPEYARIQSITLSKDAKRVAYVAHQRKDPKAAFNAPMSVAVIDGQASEPFNQITDIVISLDGKRTAYAGSTTAGRNVAYAVIDGAKSLDYTMCDNFVFSPDSQHVAYRAMAASGKSVVVLDGRESDAHEQIEVTSMQFSPDSKHFAYIAIDQSQQRVVVDGKLGPAHGAIDPRSLKFSSDGQHYRYKIRGYTGAWTFAGDDVPADPASVPSDVVSTPDGKHTAMVVIRNSGTPQETTQVLLDGKPVGDQYSRVEQLQISHDGQHVAHIANYPAGSDKKGTHAVIDGHVGSEFLRINKVLLSPDGQHIAYDATEDGMKYHVVVDSFAGPVYDQVFLGVTQQFEALQFRPDGSLEFLAETDKKLNRIVFSGDMIRSLPKPVAPTSAGALGYAQIYEFGQVKNDGRKPAVIATGPDGTLFGATSEGGEFKKGVLFNINPDGSGYKIIRPIEGGQGDGSYPSSMWVGQDGAVFGSMQGEGPSGYGIVYRAAADGSTYTILHSFTGNKDGGNPVIYAVDPDGTIYGVSKRNRTPLHLFRIKPDGSEFKIVYDAPPVMGGYNNTGVGPFVDGGDGFFYGVADLNIFKVKKDGTGYAVVRKFAGPPRDISMADRAPILGSDNMLYGFSSSDGVIYKIARDGSGYGLVIKPSDSFAGMRAIAEGSDGKLYVLAEKGLACVNKDGSEFTLLREMAGGFFPECALVRGGAFYGMTAEGAKGGSIFRYGIGGGGDRNASAPSVAFQTAPPPPIDSNVEIPPAPPQ